MGFKGVLLKVGIFLLLVAFLPGLPPYPTFPFKAFSVPPHRPLEGVLAPNQLLNNAEHWLEGQLLSPETILVRGNTTYASVFGGQILEISNVGDQIREVTKFGAECRGTFDERECGRPLGMAFDTQGNNLIVAEPYSGLWQVQIKTGERKQLVSLDEVLDGVVPRRARIPNSLAVARNGDIYWSDTASDATFENAVQALLVNPSGRLMHYSRATGKNKVLIDQVFGTNGVALNRDESVVLVGELGGHMIRRYYLKGLKAGTNDIFIDGLPGSVDNLVADEHGLWVAIVIAADLDHPSPLAMLAPFPTLRKVAARLLTILDLPFEYFYQKTGNLFALKMAHLIGNLAPAQPLFPKRGTVLRMDWEGNILAALHGDDGTGNFVAHAVRSGDHLLLGSPIHPWIGRVKLPEEVLKIVAPEGGAKVTVPKVTPPKTEKVKQEL